MTPEAREHPYLAGGISASYRWTTGRLIGEFLRGLRDGPLLLGGRCGDCRRVSCPPADICPSCGSELIDLVPVGPQGVVVAHARIRAKAASQPLEPPFAYVAVRLDGAAASFIHLAPGEEGCRLAVGDRVEAEFHPARTGSILDLRGFVRVDTDRPGKPAGALPEGASITVVTGRIDVPFKHSLGRLFPAFYESMRKGRLHGVRCPSCRRVLLPPRPMCGSCFVGVESAPVAVSDRGYVKTFTNVHIAYEGQATQPPYCYALIVLDGADGEFHHIVRTDDLAGVRVGMRVRALWRPPEERVGSFRDIECFLPED